ncbi:type II secretion system protein [Krasilnikovia sp. MM14-A1259]|uniref:type II secretion system protein n=1 Tax=Krasilnikovia sp. MM14-A1259 TaxID=3373539 RepID=UPI0037F9628E
MRDTIKRLRAAKGDEGFTLIELLVVVVIIGVLVAIAVPVYLNYRQGAADKSAQSDVRGAISTIEQYYTDNGNAYPTTPAGKQAASFNLGTATGTTSLVTLSDKTELTYVGTASSYKVCAHNTGGSGKVYFYDSTKGGSVSVPTPAVNIATCS